MNNQQPSSCKMEKAQRLSRKRVGETRNGEILLIRIRYSLIN
uniref:Uncharacterized protein n=2 Tax=unclassified Caudoviricetes TaxID=2788787 RepID=A0A8S5PIN7_9CAUD|nr:MAG TPA: hypothetical protein [Siphoviridae sp. ctJcm18]DAE06584.1 MAG TPA: hypothetical protein [Siphoviridae sp. ctUGQ45]DAG36030.1 MAG TPA: hypothetical protein [Caudoviricetes sp.]